MTGQPEVHLIQAELPEGVVLRAGDADTNAVFVGELYAETYGAEPGEAFKLLGSEYARIAAGKFSTDPASRSRTVIMPLTLVQEIYGLPGMVTHFWVTVDYPDRTHDTVRTVQLALGDSVLVLPRTHE